MSLRNRVTYLTMALAATTLTACGSIQTRSKDEASLKQIKKAALVAFHVDQPTAHTATSLAVGDPLVPQSAPHIDQMYAALNNTFGTKMGWEMLPLATIRNNPTYQRDYDKTMKGFQNKLPPGKGVTRYEVDKVMDADCLRILDVEGRDQLIDALGVDALIVSRPYVYLNGTTVMGVGSHHPVARVSFDVYRKGDKKPSWFEGGIDGDEQESISKTAFFSQEDLDSKALASAQSAFSKIDSSKQ